jgi:hypothetical protein
MTIHTCQVILALATSLFLNRGIPDVPDAVGSAEYQLETTHTHLLQNCEQSNMDFPIDPAIVRPLVPAQFELLMMSNGKAVVSFLNKRCPSITADGEGVGSGAYVSHFVKTVGPYEIIPVPGATVTRPTSYWHELEDQTDNHGLWNAGKKAGLNFEKIKGQEWQNIGAVRTGTIIEKPQVTYSWTEDYVPYPTPNLKVGVNLKISAASGARSVVQCLLIPKSSPSPVTVRADPESVWGRFYGLASISGLTTDTLTLWCNATWYPRH